jgi:hypothetical protein
MTHHSQESGGTVGASVLPAPHSREYPPGALRHTSREGKRSYLTGVLASLPLAVTGERIINLTPCSSGES